MGNVNSILDEIKKTDVLSNSWRVASAGAAYAPTEGETWRIYPSEPFGPQMGRQTAVRAEVSGVERAFWPSWIIRTYPCPQKGGKVVLRGHFLNEKPVSSIPLEELLNLLCEKEIQVSSVDTIVGLKKTYDLDGSCTGLREELVTLYHWKVVERETTTEGATTEGATTEE